MFNSSVNFLEAIGTEFLRIRNVYTVAVLGH